jgi:hypothetical protein
MLQADLDAVLKTYLIHSVWDDRWHVAIVPRHPARPDWVIDLRGVGVFTEPNARIETLDRLGQRRVFSIAGGAVCSLTKVQIAKVLFLPAIGSITYVDTMDNLNRVRALTRAGLPALRRAP